MAIWGHNNFERDDALDVLDELLSNIIATIRETFTLESSNSLYDSDGEPAIVGNIDIICTLCTHYEVFPHLATEEVLEWQKNYLATFDRTIHQYSDDAEYIKQRREVVVTTFERLRSFTRKLDERLA